MESQEALNDDERKLFEDLLADDDNEMSAAGIQRRQFLKQILAAGGGMLAMQMLGEDLFAHPAGNVAIGDLPPATIENSIKVAFKVNGSARALQVDSRMTLLDALRERLAMTGTKKGCDHGQCGACTVIIDGRRVLSCLTLAGTCEGQTVTTIEGLAKEGKLHPMQAAFIKHDGFQCGYCTPGQICSAVALIGEAKKGDLSYVTENVRVKAGPIQLSDDEIRERMSGNICRCGAYPNIVDAIKEVHSGKAVAQEWRSVAEEKS